MADTLSLVLIGVGLYWTTLVFLRRRGLLPEYIGTQGPIITLHTNRFRDLLDRIAGPKRTWRAWGNFGIGVALVVMVGSFAFFGFAALSTLRNPPPETVVNQPRNVLVLPGVNDFLPLSVAPEIIAGLALGLIVHEGGHGIMCRVGDIDIESVGLALLAFLPIGAFVEPDEESRKRASRGDQTRMFAAGIMNNFALTVVAFWLLFVPIAGSLTVVGGGVPVGDALRGSAAAEAGIDQGDRIVAVNGHAISNASDLEATLADIDDERVDVKVATGDGKSTVEVNRSLLVTHILDASPFYGKDGGFTLGTTITAVNGTPVHTESGFRAAVTDRPVARLEGTGGAKKTGAIGAAVTVADGGPLAEAGAPVGTTGIITRFDGKRIVSAADLDDALAATNPGEEVSLILYLDGKRRTFEVTMGDHPRDDHGFLGVFVTPGISGITVNEFGVRPYPAEQYLRVLGGAGGGDIPFVGRIVLALQLPLAGVIGFLPFNFAGFTGGVANFYTVTGPLSLLGGLTFVLANVLFWTGWINLNLAVFNCIPAFPLDGGHILRTSTQAVVSRLPVRSRRALTRAVTTSVGLAMLAALLVTLFGPQFLN